ncbi:MULTISPECIES: cysteine desulfurase family protein [unclassified Mesobacillus]|jgi:cysteine desulfurase|uniref:cysteine desulfurase family protein n=1 Tax=unclassified Mesobacillus TaxID=2675270 RepID=UPI00203DBC08|nr:MULTISPECIES: cysteine desulfurase family protein [unclassified Mesobacillus]MCM3122739.1 cysteine desulfurase [Mesobacillus sp. MER 33]MCM3232703.1 cysteine desulfurase [Mesobacillus sp. MER 48]
MIYLDNSATTKPYKQVLDSFIKVSEDFYGNPSSLHKIGGQAEKLLQQARSQVARLLRVKETEILFTSGGTESNNLAIKGIAMAHRERGRHIITTSIEHASVHNAMVQLESLGYEITYVKPDSTGFVSADSIQKELREDTILVSVMHVNNEVGTIQPIEEIGIVLKKYPKAFFHVDFVQGIGKVPLDLYHSGVHLATISGHKFHGLKGTGALFMKEGVRLSPLLSGGNQEWKQRSGTENVAGMVAMAKALRMTLELRAEKLDQMKSAMEILRNGISHIKEITIHTPEEKSAPHILNFSISGLKAETFVHALEEKDIYVSTTSACSSKKKAASKTLLEMGVPVAEAESAIRISLTYSNTAEEAEIAAKAIAGTVKHLSEVIKK